VKAVIYPVCAVVSWVATLLRARLLRQGWDPGVVTMCVCLALSGVVFTVSTPAVAAGLDRALGVPNLGAFCMHVSAVTLSFAVQVQVINWAYGPAEARARIRTRLFVLAGVVAVMAALFASTWQPTREAQYLLSASEHGGTRFTIYLLFYLAAVGAGYGMAAWMSWRYARVCAKPWLRRGLRVSAVGFALVLGYVGTRVATLVGARLGVDPTAWEFLVPLFVGLSLPITLVGLLMPAWGPRLEASGAAWRRWRDLRRLEPLWRAFYDAVPGIALDPPGSRRRLVPRDVGLRLLRRVIEISDGRLSVAPYVPDGVAAAARARGEMAGLAGEELDAVVEAAQIAAGLAALGRGAEPLRDATPAGAVAVTGGADLAAEVTRLVRVTRAFTSSPVVAQLRALPTSTARPPTLRTSRPAGSAAEGALQAGDEVGDLGVDGPGGLRGPRADALVDE
jgi:hypothetical protein